MFKYNYINKIWGSSYFKITLIFIICFHLLLDLYGLSLFPIGPIDYEIFGTVGDWFSGMLTVIAVVIATISLKLSSIEIKSVLDDKEMNEMKEEGNLFCWLEFIVDKVSSEYIGLNMIILNQLNYPVYDWRVYIDGISDPVFDQNNAGNIIPIKNIIKLNSDVYEYVKNKKSIPRVKIVFISTKGYLLERNFNGKLKKIG
jgi:hypothetical protein